MLATAKGAAALTLSYSEVGRSVRTSSSDCYSISLLSHCTAHPSAFHFRPLRCLPSLLVLHHHPRPSPPPVLVARRRSARRQLSGLHSRLVCFDFAQKRILQDRLGQPVNLARPWLLEHTHACGSLRHLRSLLIL